MRLPWQLCIPDCPASWRTQRMQLMRCVSTCEASCCMQNTRRWTKLVVAVLLGCHLQPGLYLRLYITSVKTDRR
jgi:hypothetical protein